MNGESRTFQQMPTEKRSELHIIYICINAMCEKVKRFYAVYCKYMCVKCKCDAIWMQKRYLFIGRQNALMTALAHTFIMLLLLRPFITIAILLFIIIPLLGACTNSSGFPWERKLMLTQTTGACVKFTHSFDWMGELMHQSTESISSKSMSFFCQDYALRIDRKFNHFLCSNALLRHNLAPALTLSNTKLFTKLLLRAAEWMNRLISVIHLVKSNRKLNEQHVISIALIFFSRMIWTQRDNCNNNWKEWKKNTRRQKRASNERYYCLHMRL